MTVLAPAPEAPALEEGARPVRRLRRHPALGGPGVWAAGAVVALVLLAALLPDLLAPQDPLEISLSESFDAPSIQHVFGTDQSGRDVFSRVIHGAGQSLAIGLGATAIGLVGALVLGLVGGLAGRFADATVTRVIEVLYAFPGILLAMILIAVYGNSALTQMVAVGVATMPGYARMVRGQVLAVRGSLYVEAARALGHPPARILLRTLLPNAFRPLTVLITLGIGQAIVWAAALGFLGMGVQPPTAEWGAMLNAGRTYIQQAWWMDFFPGITIVLFTLSLTVLGRHLQRINDSGILR
ncbi:ABC transporter permease [Brachybacterium fresconis]|uniref:Peptide/nickel transport system permease protein n=1 Tax=Brachybacterium fresconis TaxID=173363 RepID=A0ABS4YIN3_9MICO|nr:ABC transporter permease [Brachybacterium fresconis]MBP2408365.1 peptide/nickel transport system permease protein [Brachybacterium fresconis]